MTWARLALVLTLGLGPGPALAVDDPPHVHNSLDADRPAPLSGSSIYLAASTWTDMDGKPALLRSLRGKPVALAMVYTNCTTACPLLLANLKLIESALSPEVRGGVWFALASFDSERDRPDVLKKFAAARDLDPSRWRLFHGDPAAVRELAMLLGVRYKRNAQGDFDHSNIITILDGEGVVRHQQVGLGSNAAEAADLLASLARSRGVTR
jgi:protein SCO1/2